MAGRKTKLNADVQKRICDALQKGNTRRVACLVGGIAEQTLSNWLNKGENPRLKKDGSPYKEDEPFIEFLGSIKKAEATAEQEALVHIKNAMPDSWQAAAWYLERKRPQDWAKQDRNAAREEGNEKLDEIDRKLEGLKEYGGDYASPSGS